MKTITSDIELTNLVAELAQDQLVLDTAANKVKATIEAVKAAHEEGTRDLAAKIEDGFKLITAYCEANKDRLFPIKGGKRSKTYKILQHVLQYRSSHEVTAPKDIMQRLQTRLAELTLTVRSITTPADLDDIEAEIELLNSLIRIAPPTLNKDAAGEALKSEVTALTLAPLGLNRTQTETFKLTFTFTPEG